MRRRSRPEERLHAVGEDAGEPHVLDGRRETVGVDELGVPEDFRFYAELLLDDPPVEHDLVRELLARGEPRERVVGCLGKDLNAIRCGEAPERRQRLGRPGTQLFEDRPREGEGNGESRVLLEESLAERRGGRVAPRCNRREEVAVDIVVEVTVLAADVEIVVATQPVRLVHLEVQADRDHDGWADSPTNSR